MDVSIAPLYHVPPQQREARNGQLKSNYLSRQKYNGEPVYCCGFVVPYHAMPHPVYEESMFTFSPTL